jgi:hypothetical protein
MNINNLFFKAWKKIPMKGKYTFFIFAGMLIGLLLQTSCSSIKNLMTKYPQDNIVEEIIEDAIEENTGLDLDLSPTSKEK